jgi:hypothetical protein
MSQNLTYATGRGTGVGNQTLIESPWLCTLQTCDLSLASFRYLPTLPGNAIYSAIFGVLLIGQLWRGIQYKTWGYTTAMILGLVCLPHIHKNLPIVDCQLGPRSYRLCGAMHAS